ncbi:helix-turn-helix domain-containing protein [Pseudoflavitalea sp. G-6-1-2]|uniref:helix-turn-helix domain-containing protein n=1 Tax=Pseudoflavitalea sp. G-6-1-2 TaxID=2728841 RepID=UPI00146EEFE1|nr:helix-turn-helix domain-containing protein [Pseudoflavitalea sp. G-6-1-2]NML21420.1 helix-turn-helix domain-containing protein [Pseudoflavitalea sp. G-6-1-2]
MAKKEAPVFHIGQQCESIIDNMKVTSFTNESCTMVEFEENHRHQYYEIIWLRRGKGVHMIDMVNYPYSGSVFFLLSPGQIHQISPEEKADGFLIKFLPALFKDTRDMEDTLIGSHLFDNIQAKPMLTIPAAMHTVFEELLHKMEIEYNSNEEDKEVVLHSYLKILLTQIQRLKRTQITQEHARVDAGYLLFTKYKSAIEHNFKKLHGVQEYADMLSTQARNLNAICRKFAGKTAGGLIADRILLEARRELYYSTDNIKGIGYSLGFEDPAYFTRFFKKHAGISPQEYKENNPKAGPSYLLQAGS